MSSRPAPPGGWPPPDRAILGGETVRLAPLAEETARRYFGAHSEDLERYGSVARDWELHDTLHLLNWAFGDAEGYVDLGQQVAWLAGVLEARGFPLAHLATNLQLAADVVSEQLPEGAPVAERLSGAAALVRERKTFL